MSVEQRDWFAKWTPLMVSILVNMIILAFGYGRMVEQIIPLQEYAKANNYERSVERFVTRQEYQTRNSARDNELSEMKQAIRDMRRETNEKLDVLLLRHGSGSGN